MPTVPIAQGSNAGGTGIQDIMTEYYDFVVANPGDFTVGGVVGGADPTSFWMTHATVGQINYRIVGGQIMAIIDPDSSITDSANPGAPTNASPEMVAIPTLSGISGLVSMVQYGDATLLLLKNTANSTYSFGFHHGQIAQVLNSSDATAGLTGVGMLNGIPSNNLASTAQFWWCSSGTASNRLSTLRDSTSTWFSPGYSGNAAGTNPGNAGNTPMGALPMSGDVGNAPSNASDVIKGIYKYIRIDAEGTLTPLQVRPSPGTDQGWLAWSNVTGSTRFRILWNKLVTP